MNQPREKAIRKLSFGANLAVCVFYAMGIVALSEDRQGRLDLGGDGAVLLLCFLSPGLLWAFIAWLAARKPWLSAVSLLISAPLMVVGLLGRHADWKSFHDSVPGQEVQSIAGFLGLLLQWLVGVVLLMVVAIVRWRSRVEAGEGPASPVR